MRKVSILLTLDLNGHVLSGTVESFLTTSGTLTIHDGWFHSSGRTVSGGNTYINKVTLNGGYYDRMPSIPSAGGSYTYGSGKSMQAIAPAATHLHETTGETNSYGYQVK